MVTVVRMRRLVRVARVDERALRGVCDVIVGRSARVFS
jgi:hypothetical protein